MFDRRALSAFSESLRVNTRNMTEEQAREQLHRVAERERARVIEEQSARSGGVAPTAEVIVDGHRRARIEDADARSTIVIEYEYLREVAVEILRALSVRSPQRSGRYLQSFMMLVDGSPTADWEDIKHNTREVLIVNIAPYARRLEIGYKRDGTPFVVQVRRKITEDVATRAAKRFKDVARVFHTFVEHAQYPDVPNYVAAVRRRRKEVMEPMRYPAIRILRL